jgi:hypothetical protein
MIFPCLVLPWGILRCYYLLKAKASSSSHSDLWTSACLWTPSYSLCNQLCYTVFSIFWHSEMSPYFHLRCFRRHSKSHSFWKLWWYRGWAAAAAAGVSWRCSVSVWYLKVWFSARASDFSFSKMPRLALTFLFNGYRVFCALTKWPGCKIDHSPLSSPEVKNGWSCISTTPVYFQGVDKDNFEIFSLLGCYTA